MERELSKQEGCREKSKVKITNNAAAYLSDTIPDNGNTSS
jgi:hypothetical protein